MPANTKIATCCYCGTRAALELIGSVRHELACANCGAPLHNLKMLKADVAAPRSDPRGRKVPGGLQVSSAKPASGKKPKKRSRKKSRGLTSRFLKEAFDVIEDIFD